MCPFFFFDRKLGFASMQELRCNNFFLCFVSSYWALVIVKWSLLGSFVCLIGQCYTEDEPKIRHPW